MKKIKENILTSFFKIKEKLTYFYLHYSSLYNWVVRNTENIYDLGTSYS